MEYLIVKKKGDEKTNTNIMNMWIIVESSRECIIGIARRVLEMNKAIEKEKWKYEQGLWISVLHRLVLLLKHDKLKIIGKHKIHMR